VSAAALNDLAPGRDSCDLFPGTIAVFFATDDPRREPAIMFGGQLHWLSDLKKRGLLAVGPMEAIVLQQLADKMRGLAQRLAK
jgi:hypothetical protein